MPSVLVVDDDADIANLLRLMLQNNNYAVATAAHGAAALVWLRHHAADVIVSDIRMPVLSGWDLREALQSDPRYAHVPLILTSTLELERAAVEHIGCAFLPKPFSYASVLATVQGALMQAGVPVG